MQVSVDPVRCQSIGICVKSSPVLFHFEPGSKKAAGPVGDIPPHLETICLEIARQCPTGAIRIRK